MMSFIYKIISDENSILLLSSITTIAGLSFAVFKTYFKIQQISSEKRKSHKIDFKNSNSFLKKDSWKEKNDFVIEKWFLSTTGIQLEASKIRYFLSQRDPSSLLREYLRGKRKIEDVRNKKGIIISFIFKKPLNDDKKLSRKKVYNFLTYFSLAMIGSIPLMIIQFIDEFSFEIILTLLLWAISFYTLAFLALLDILELSAAEKVVKHK